jgi:enoyl-CoA hydratase/carnithine racemase
MAGLHIERPADGVALLMLDRQASLNALDDELLLRELPEALAQLGDDDEVRVVVVSGEGRAFCAGADLECSGFAQPSAIEADAFMQLSHRTPVRIRQLRQTTIAALKGPVVGAGLGLALACDFRFAAPKLTIGSPFITMGLVPDFGVTYFLPRLIGTERALDLLLTGRLLDAEEALAVGLVSRICEDVVQEAVTYATLLAQAPPAAAATTRRNVYRSIELGLEAEILEQEVRSQSVALFGSEFSVLFAKWRDQVQNRKKAAP